MIKEEFIINVISDDPFFCTKFATECNKYGFSLNFIELEDIFEENKNIFKDNLAIAIVDLDVEILDLANLIKGKNRIPVFGIYKKFNKTLHVRAKEKNFDLTFTKSLLINSIKSIVVHIVTQAD